MLNPLPSKKMGMFYVTLAELSPRALLNANSWLLFAVIPSMVVEDVEGGISRVTRAVGAAGRRAATAREPLTFVSARHGRSAAVILRQRLRWPEALSSVQQRRE